MSSLLEDSVLSFAFFITYIIVWIHVAFDQMNIHVIFSCVPATHSI